MRATKSSCATQVDQSTASPCSSPISPLAPTRSVLPPGTTGRYARAVKPQQPSGIAVGHVTDALRWCSGWVRGLQHIAALWRQWRWVAPRSTPLQQPPNRLLRTRQHRAVCVGTHLHTSRHHSRRIYRLAVILSARYCLDVDWLICGRTGSVQVLGNGTNLFTIGVSVTVWNITLPTLRQSSIGIVR